MNRLEHLKSALFPRLGQKRLTLKDPNLAFIIDALVGGGNRRVKGNEYGASIWVYRAANVWASAKSCPIIVYRNGDIVERHPLAHILERPNMTCGWDEFMEDSILSLALCGRSMWLVNDGDWDGQSDPAYMHVVDAKGMTIERGGIDHLGRITAWRMSIGDGRTRMIPAESVIYTRLPNPYKRGYWMSPLDALSETISADHSAHVHNRYLMENHGRIPGVISYDDNLGEQELKERAKTFHELFSNSEAAGKWLHLVRTKVQQLSQSAKDMDWEAALKIFREEIAAAFNIPPVMAGILDKATYSNFEQADKALVEGCFIPLLGRYASSINKMLSGMRSGRGYSVAFDAENHYQALQESEGKRIEKYERLVKSGISPARAAEIADIDIGELQAAHNTVWMPTNMVAVGGELVASEDDAVPASTGATAKIQDQALNGAQVASMLEIIARISRGELSPDGAVQVILVAFPTVDEAEARRIVAGAIKQTMPDEAAAQEQKAVKVEQKQKAKTDTKADDSPSSDAEKETRERYLSAIWRAQMNRRLPHERSAQRTIKRYLYDQRVAILNELDAVVASWKSAKDFNTKEIDPSKLNAEVLLDAGWDKELVKRLLPVLLTAGSSAAKLLLDDMGKPLDLFSESAINAMIEQQTVLLPKVNETTRTALAASSKELLEAVAAGTNIDDAAEAMKKNVRDFFKGSEARATTIARTEIGRAMEGGRYEQLLGAGAATKVWISSRDPNVRDAHASVDGDEVPVDSTFSNGLRYPLDPNGSAAQTVNCRCTLGVGKFE